MPKDGLDVGKEGREVEMVSLHRKHRVGRDLISAECWQDLMYANWRAVEFVSESP